MRTTTTSSAASSPRPARRPRPDKDRHRELSPAPARETKRGKTGGSLTKELLAGTAGAPSPFRESSGQMVARVCRDLGGTSGIVVLNDEPHHFTSTGTTTPRTRASPTRTSPATTKPRPAERRGDPPLVQRPARDQREARRQGGDDLSATHPSCPAPATGKARFPLGGLRLRPGRGDRVRYREDSSCPCRRQRDHARRALPQTLAGYKGRPAEEEPQGWHGHPGPDARPSPG
jgi:hypothetical protein